MVESTRRSAALALATGLLLALPAPAHADPWRPRLGIEGGPNYGSVNEGGFAVGDPAWSFGGEAGLVARWETSAVWAIEAAPGWQRQVARTTGTFLTSAPFTGGIDFGQTVQFDRIALPLRAVLHPGASGWSLEGGLTGAWLAHAGREANVSSSVYTLPAMAARRTASPTAAIFEQAGTFNSTDWTDNFQRWDVSAVAGAGWDHPVADHTLRLRARWQQGLTDIGKYGSNVKLYGATATVGWLW